MITKNMTSGQQRSPTSVELKNEEWSSMISKNHHDYPLCYSMDDEDDEELKNFIGTDHVQERRKQRLFGKKHQDHKAEDLEEELHCDRIDVDLEDDTSDTTVVTAPAKIHNQTSHKVVPCISLSQSFDSVFLQSATATTASTDSEQEDRSDVSLRDTDQVKIDLLQNKVEAMARMMSSGLLHLDDMSSCTSRGSDEAVLVKLSRRSLEEQAALDRLAIAGLRARNSSLSSENAELRSFVTELEVSLVSSTPNDATRKLALEVENVLLRRHLKQSPHAALVACPTDESGLFDSDLDLFAPPDLNQIIEAVKKQLMQFDGSSSKVSDLQLKLFNKDRKIAELQQQIRDLELEVRQWKNSQPLVLSTIPLGLSYRVSRAQKSPTRKIERLSKRLNKFFGNKPSKLLRIGSMAPLNDC